MQQQSNKEDMYVQMSSTGKEEMVFDPFNPNNVMITEEDVEIILKKYGVTAPIHNLRFYQRAFVNQSYIRRPEWENRENNIVIVPCPHDCIPLFTKSNERLEFLGDGVLELITKYYLYERFPKEEPGFMTDKKIALVKNEAIGKIAMEMGLHKWLILSKHAEEKQKRTNLKKLGCLFEAFLGALFLDFNKISIKDEEGWFQSLFLTGPGLQMAHVFVKSIFETHVDWTYLIETDENYKNILQVKIQKEFKTTPHYLEGVMEDDKYNMSVYLCLGQPIHSVNLKHSITITQFQCFENMHDYLKSHHQKIFVLLGSGQHKTKRKAEQLASYAAIQVLESFVV
jgi:dsRNA-specific ribonuclease